MSSHHITRRTFIQSSLSTAAALSAAGPALGALGANDRIRLGVIGTGGRGNAHIHDLKNHSDVELVAICDVDDAQLDRAAQNAAGFGAKPERYKDFRKLIDRKDIDAVFITSCCHWHAIPAVQAIRAGKDLYIEKPSGHTIHEGRVIADEARKHGRVVQIGLQQRSGPHWINAVERIKAGEIGQVTTVHTWNAWNIDEMGGRLGNPPDGEAPAGVDYDMWLGPAPKRAFNPARFHFGYYFFFDYSSGMTCAWGVHLFDVVAWALGYNLKSVAATGGIYVLKDARDTPDTLEAVFDCGHYTMSYSLNHNSGWRRHGNMDHGIEFVGTQGVLQINRSGFEMFHEADRAERKPYYTEKTIGDDTPLHQRNFLDCMRSRKQPRVNAETGHQATAYGYLANISYRVGRGIRWDAEKDTIPGDPEAARLLTKEYREPWSL